jgi:hypothetical protein
MARHPDALEIAFRHLQQQLFAGANTPGGARERQNQIELNWRQ